MSWRREYLEQLFNEEYDYHYPQSPWMLDFRVEKNRPLVGQQITTFHHHWVKKLCIDEGKVGLSFDVDLPDCFVVSGNKDHPDAHFFANPESLHVMLKPGKYPLLVTSAVIGSLPCQKPEEIVKCDGSFDVVKTMRNWATLLKPGGLLIAAIVDKKIATQQGTDLRKMMPNLTHTWSETTFEEMVSTYLYDVFEAVEIGGFCNYFNFGVVLRKI